MNKPIYLITRIIKKNLLLFWNCMLVAFQSTQALMLGVGPEDLVRGVVHGSFVAALHGFHSSLLAARQWYRLYAQTTPCSWFLDNFCNYKMGACSRMTEQAVQCYVSEDGGFD
jgi:hypothetical protein